LAGLTGEQVYRISYLKIKKSIEGKQNNYISFKKTMLLRITLRPWYLTDTFYDTEWIETKHPECGLKQVTTLKAERDIIWLLPSHCSQG